MWWRASTSSERAIAGALVALAIAFASPRALAQSCCAGTGAVQPARLAMHEDWLAGARATGATVLGSFAADGNYHRLGSGTSELDLEQDLFATARVLGHGQLTALAPLVETRRAAAGVSELGGGLGDVQLAARWDFTEAGRSATIPGVAAIGGVTFPTGKPADASTSALGTDATGVGAYQVTAGAAVEQTFGPWLVLAMGLVTARTARDVGSVHSRLAPQLTATAAVAYAFPDEEAIALTLSYAVEGNATIDGVAAPDTARRAPTATLSAMLPIGDATRVLAATTVAPPISGLGANQPATFGLAFTVVRSFR